MGRGGGASIGWCCYKDGMPLWKLCCCAALGSTGRCSPKRCACVYEKECMCVRENTRAGLTGGRGTKRCPPRGPLGCCSCTPSSCHQTPPCATKTWLREHAGSSARVPFQNTTGPPPFREHSLCRHCRAGGCGHTPCHVVRVAVTRNVQPMCVQVGGVGALCCRVDQGHMVPAHGT